MNRLPITALLLLAATTVARAAPPAVTSLFPAGGQVGTTVDVTATGTFEKWPVEVWCSSPGVTAKASKDKGKLAVTVAADAKPSVAWLRLSDDTGASALRPFVVGVLPEVAEKEPNDEATKPQLVDRSCVVNGKLAKNNDVDCFAVKLAKGQTLVASLLANHTLRSPMDAILQVVSADGFVLDQSHDHHGLDPQLAFTAPKDGTFVVRVFAFPSQPDSSIRFFGSEACVYRLTLTTAGFVDYAIPLAVTTDSPIKPRPVGWNLGMSPIVPSVIAPRQEAHPCFDFTENPSNTPLSPPFTLTGCVKEPNAVNVFLVKVTKGKPVTFQVESRKLELPLTPVLRVLDESGKVLTRVEPAQPNADCEAAVTPSKDETLRVEVRDLYHHGGPRFVYRLRAVTLEPDFEAAIATDRIALVPGTPLDVPLKFTIKGGTLALLTADLKLKAEGLPPSVTVALVPVDAMNKEPKLRFTAEAGGVSKPFRLNLVGMKIARLIVATLTEFDTTTADLWLTVGPNATVAPPTPKKKK
ncbi:PPC domain-containing protein [Limnoglobus roseus]|uniref:Pre-peptidase n=1 Tax=Limnoglobus roseus TaxID=2598579 RepID=A0A5C1AVW7_9BACT|nr:PPC domain-containing protein [Limnoglobus roseus]QEL20948.1 pre-peptidase [Limnoglobus roseus]